MLNTITLLRHRTHYYNWFHCLRQLTVSAVNIFAMCVMGLFLWSKTTSKVSCNIGVSLSTPTLYANHTKYLCALCFDKWHRVSVIYSESVNIQRRPSGSAVNGKLRDFICRKIRPTYATFNIIPSVCWVAIVVVWFQFITAVVLYFTSGTSLLRKTKF